MVASKITGRNVSVIDGETIKRQCENRLSFVGHGQFLTDIRAAQAVVYTMCGGGFLGRSAAEQPDGFYIDDRVSKLPYPHKAIYEAVKHLKIMAEVAQLDPKHLPEMGWTPNFGIF